MDDPVEREKPWRPGDHPRPGPSWGEDDHPKHPERTNPEHTGVPDAED